MHAPFSECVWWCFGDFTARWRQLNNGFHFHQQMALKTVEIIFEIFSNQPMTVESYFQ
jgi:hypothetical protein